MLRIEYCGMIMHIFLLVRMLEDAIHLQGELLSDRHP